LADAEACGGREDHYVVPGTELEHPDTLAPGFAPAAAKEGRDSGADIDRRLATAPVSVRRLVLRFALAGFVALVLVSVVTALVSQRIGTDLAVTDARRVTVASTKGIIEPVLDDALLSRDSAALERLDQAVRRDVLGGSLVRVKVWTRDGTIIYSDEPRLIGSHFGLGPEEQEVFDGGPTVAHVSDLSEPENQFETETKLLEVYQLAHTEQGTPVLVEAYFRYSGVTAVGRQLWSRFVPIAIGALVVLELILVPFAWSLARRLRAAQQQRERLLRHAIEASDNERRRLASDLHDGVVQDLTGVSLSLAAAARSSPTPDPRFGEASTRVRDSVEALRSLLVDIYPANPHEDGLEVGLNGLLSRLNGRGIETHLDVGVDDLGLPMETTTLLYRSAQEALRNVAAHAAATDVGVTVQAGDGTVTLTVRDNGRGFSTDDMNRRMADGHVGLRALSGLVADAGGSTTILSAPGRGTELTVTLPLAEVSHS
jgi:two-component system, NarL family, sensor kinase